MKTYSIFKYLIIFSMIFLGACKFWNRGSSGGKLPNKPLVDVGPALSDAASSAGKTGQEVDSSAGKITTSAHNVKANADMASGKVGVSEKGAVDSHLSIIKGEADVILVEADKLRAAGIDVSKLAVNLQNLALNVQTLTQRSEALEEQNEKLKVDLEQAISDKTAALRKAMVYMIIAGAVIIAVCMFLVFSGNPKAMGGAVGGIILVATAMAIMAMTKYMWLFGIVGAAGVLLVLGVMGYHILDHLKHKRAMREVVATGEEAKKLLTPEAKEKVFGPEGEGGRAAQLQSEATEDIVRRAKNDLRSK